MRDGYHELVTFIEDHKREYSRFIAMGETKEEESMDICFEVKKLQQNWYAGRIEQYQFQAKVYDIGSKFGINNGRVSKLSLREDGVEIFSYDRGWDKKPSDDEHWVILWELMNRLEELPSW